ncbi:MAG: SH3 domain-containing protein, partial [Anaerolineae bacterium]
MRTFPIPLVCLAFVLSAGLLLAGCQLPLPLFRTAPTATITREPTSTATTPASPTFTPSPASTFTPTPLPATIRVRADVLNVRKAPSTSADIVAKLQQGTMLPVLARTPAGDWLLIRLGSGEQAWVAAEWVEVSVPVESLPVAPGLEAAPTRPAPSPSPTPVPT